VAHDPDDDLELRRRAGPLEGFFQEAVRRAANLGISTFFTTEEAVRRAFSESVPPDWLEYLNRQGTDLRSELLDRMSREFGEWLPADFGLREPPLEGARPRALAAAAAKVTRPPGPAG